MKLKDLSHDGQCEFVLCHRFKIYLTLDIIHRIPQISNRKTFEINLKTTRIFKISSVIIESAFFHIRLLQNHNF